MGKPNHSFEKRRREMDKKKKQEAKRQKKLEKGNTPAAEEPDQDINIETPDLGGNEDGAIV